MIWLLGDFFNIFGAVLQGVLPTMTILAVYYTLADIVLLGQCFWYKGFTLKDEVKSSDDEEESDDDEEEEEETENAPLLSDARQTINGNGYHSFPRENGIYTPPTIADIDRRHSSSTQHSFRERYLSIDGTHLSPVTPLLDADSEAAARSKPATRHSSSQSTTQTILFNLGTIVLVCAAGVLGWWLSTRSKPNKSPSEDTPSTPLEFNLWGQVFGYICTALYLGSRVPQLLLNYRRKSTDGISMLFFLFACIGNLTYVLSIVAYKPVCEAPKHCEPGEARSIYGRYIAVNLSWLLGSFGTLVLDAFVFVQYFLYRKDDESDDEEETDDEE